MKIKSEYLAIDRSATDDRGQKLEPEELPAARIVQADFGLSGNMSGPTGLVVPGSIEQHASVIEFADAVKSQCFTCRNFNQRAWNQYRRQLEHGTIEQRQELNAIRTALIVSQNASVQEMQAGPDGDVDVEHSLSLLGICNPLTEMAGGEKVIVFPLSSCPPELCSIDKPNGAYLPIDLDSERVGIAGFDQVMHTAQGR